MARKKWGGEQMDRLTISMTPAKLQELKNMKAAMGASSLSEVIRLALIDLKLKLARAQEAKP